MTFHVNSYRTDSFFIPYTDPSQEMSWRRTCASCGFLEGDHHAVDLACPEDPVLKDELAEEEIDEEMAEEGKEAVGGFIGDLASDLSREEYEVFETGATRSRLGDDYRFDLISPIALRRLAARYALGAKSHGPHNWRRGMPASMILNHMLAHLTKYMEGVEPDDDHLAAISWGAAALMENEERIASGDLPEELDDRYEIFGPEGEE